MTDYFAWYLTGKRSCFRCIMLLAIPSIQILNLWEHQSTWNPNMPVRGTVFCIKGVCGIRGANQGMAESR